MTITAAEARIGRVQRASAPRCACPVQMVIVACASTAAFVAVEIEKWLRRRGSVEG